MVWSEPESRSGGSEDCETARAARRAWARSQRGRDYHLTICESGYARRSARLPRARRERVRAVCPVAGGGRKNPSSTRATRTRLGRTCGQACITEYGAIATSLSCYRGTRVTTRILKVPGIGFACGCGLLAVAGGAGARSAVGRYTVPLCPSTAIVRAPGSVVTVCASANLPGVNS